MLKYRGVVRERVAFRPKIVDKETRLCDLGGFTTVIDQFELVLGLLSSYIIIREI